MTLTIALRIIATLLILACVFQYIVFQQLLIKSIVVAHVLYILSIFSEKHAHRIAVISLGLGIVVPIGAWRVYEVGSATLGFFIFNVVIFLYLGYIALQCFEGK